MRVLSICEYLTVGDRGPAHWDPYCITNALKRRHFAGTANLSINGQWHTISAGNADAAFNHSVAWAAERLAPQIRAAVHWPITIVPIPGHACVSVADVRAHRLMHLATAIADALNAPHFAPIAKVSPMLFWDTAQASASSGGGTRNAADVLPHYRHDVAEAAAAHMSSVVLVDDVVTTGARLSAAEHYLRSQGVNVADIAFAVARTVHAKWEPFGVHVETYPPVV